jgi:zinc protease
MTVRHSTNVFLAIFAMVVTTTAARAAPREVTSAEGITEYALPNGLHVLLFPEPAKPTITVNMTYLVGSRSEGYGETGMAHLLEHLMFKGSTRHPNIPQELTSHGARPNGTTSEDRTNYFETFAASDENLKWALSLEADRMVHSFIAKKDLDTEMTVVRNEFEKGENDPGNILNERVLETSYLWHSYGHPTIGARSDIENVPIERLQAFWKKYYQPDNAYLVVAGKIDPAKTLALVDRIFAPLPRPKRTLISTYTREPPQDGERTVTLQRTGDVQVVEAAYHVPAGAHPDAAALDVLSDVLGIAPAGRLYKALVDAKKATSADVWFDAKAEPGIFAATAQVRQNQSLDDARATLLATLDAAAKQPVTQEEVDRVKTATLKSFELALTKPDSLGLTLSEWIAKGDWRLFFLFRDRIRTVTPADVQRVAAAYLKPSNRTVGVFLPTAAPDRAVIPEAPALDAMLKGYKGDPPVAAGEAFDPSPANIESRVARAELPVGMKLAFLPKKTRGQTVVMNLALRYGDEQRLKNRGQVPFFTSALLDRGTVKHTRQQIHDELDRLKARVSFSSLGMGQTRVSIETLRPQLPDVLALVAEILRTPSFPADELEKLRQEWLAGAEEQKSEPGAIVGNAVRRHMSPYPAGDCRYEPTIDERIAQINAVKLEDVRKFYADMYGASAAQATVVGDFDPEAVRKQLSDLFNDWKSPGPYTRAAGQYFAVEPVTQSFETPDKTNAVFQWALNLPLRDDDPDYPALLLGGHLLGGGFLNSRLAVRIRQKEGISYGIGGGFWAHPLDKTGGFSAQAIYAPQNAERLTKAFDEEIVRALHEGFTEQEVAEAKAGWLQSAQVSRAQDAGLSGKLNDYLYLGRTFAWDADLEKRVSSVTPEEIRTVLAKYLSLSKLTRMKGGDFAHVQTAAAR